MKVIIAHNCYGSYSGEEAVVEAQVKSLSQNSVEVVTWFYDERTTPKSALSKGMAFFAGIFNPISSLKFFLLLIKCKPDLVHFHNIYPWISHGPILLCRLLGVPYILHVHNYRIICPSATRFHKNAIYDRGIDVGPFSIVRDNVFESYFKSLGYYLRFKFYKWFSIEGGASKIIYVSNFLKHFCSAFNMSDSKGFEQYRHVTIYNPLPIKPNKSICVHMKTSRIKKIGFLGRVSTEKGVDILISLASRRKDLDFIFAGKVSQEYQAPDNCVFLGHVDANEIDSFFSRIDALVIPSLWDETFGLIVIESIARNVPVIVSNKGALPELMALFKGCSVFDGSVESLDKTINGFNIDTFLKHESFNKVILERNFGLLPFGRNLIEEYNKVLRLKNK